MTVPPKTERHRRHRHFLTLLDRKMGRRRKQKIAMKQDDDPAADLRELIALCEDRKAPIPVDELKEKLTEAKTNGPAILRAHDGKDETLLHYVCCNEHVTLDLVEFLVELYPEAVKHQSTVVRYGDSTPGWYPLHRACINEKIPLDVVAYLIDLFSDALMIPVFDYTPLAWIIFNPRCAEDEETDDGQSLRIDLVRYIITKAPACVRVRVERNSTVIHLACMLTYPSLELVQMLIEQWPDALSIFSGAGELPLHVLLSRPRLNTRVCPAPLALVQLLIDGFPAAVSTLSRGMFSSLPLHMACSSRHEESLEVIQLLVEAYPEAVSIQGYARDTPLHNLLRSGGASQKIEVVRYIVEQSPNALQLPNRDGILPLQYAVQSLDIVQYLVEQYPDAAQNSDCFLHAAKWGKLEVIRYLHGLNPMASLARDSDSNTCLHGACEYQREGQLDIFEFLLSLNPDAIRIANNNGDLPLHLACKQRGMGEDVVRFLLVRNPDAIKVKNNDHCLPLHLASSRDFINHTSSGSIFPMLINAYPAAVREFDNEGRLPLHHACRHGIPITDIKFLVKLYPSSIRVVSPNHGLPIHQATTATSRPHDSIILIRYLEEMAPESLNTYVTGIGLPLHFAAQRGSKEVFEYLLDARYQNYNGTSMIFHDILWDRDLLDKGLVADHFLEEFPRNVVTDRDWMGRTPLHVAVSTNLATSFIQKIMNHDTNAVQLRDKSNSVPLHYALRHGDPANAVGLLLDQYARAVEVADTNNFLPLHVACRHGASLDIVKRLVDLYEESVTARDSKGELALHKACRGGHLALVEFLADKDMRSVRIPNSSGTLPIFILCQASGKQPQCLLDENAALGAIWQLLRKHPEAILPGAASSSGGSTTSSVLLTSNGGETNVSFTRQKAYGRRKRIRLD